MKRRSPQAGQTALMIVMGISVALSTLIMFTVNRMGVAQKTVTRFQQRAKAYEILDSAGERLRDAYTRSGCDPGTTIGSEVFQPVDIFAMGAGSPENGIGLMFSFARPNVTSTLYAAPYNQAGMEYYFVHITRLFTVERNGGLTDINAALPDPSGAVSMSMISLGLATVPAFNGMDKLGTGSATIGRKVGSEAVTPVGSRDMAVELAVAYPPGRPKQVAFQTIVLVNTCSEAKNWDGASTNSGDYLEITQLPAYQFSNVMSPKCVSLAGNWSIGGDPVTGETGGATPINGRALSYMRRTLFQGAEYDPGGSSSATYSNCYDINRDHMLTDVDIDLVEKLMKGYIPVIPPIFPESYIDTTLNHRLYY